MSDEQRVDAGDRKSFGMKGPRANATKFFRKKVCKFCVGKAAMDYKNAESLKRFVSDTGKILPRRITGTCASHQRALTREIKRARTIAVLPFAGK
ncbi:MAG: 30S ribosomal protein S18 [Spirochaetales bacterium]|nr:30S ribosomal protein S18 [Spirochaetales bacterium]